MGLRVCCAPLPALRFVAFRASLLPTMSTRRLVSSATARPFSRRYTLRRVPLVSSRTASLRPLPSCRCRCHAPRCLHPEALSHRGETGPATRRDDALVCRSRLPRRLLTHRGEPRHVRRAPPGTPDQLRCDPVAGSAASLVTFREQPASRPCSTDESVVAPWPLPVTCARSSHGLVSSSRSCRALSEDCALRCRPGHPGTRCCRRSESAGSTCHAPASRGLGRSRTSLWWFQRDTPRGVAPATGVCPELESHPLSARPLPEPAHRGA